MCRPTRLQFRGRLIRLGEMSEDDAQSLHRGTGALLGVAVAVPLASTCYFKARRRRGSVLPALETVNPIHSNWPPDPISSRAPEGLAGVLDRSACPYSLRVRRLPATDNTASPFSSPPAARGRPAMNENGGFLGSLGPGEYYFLSRRSRRERCYLRLCERPPCDARHSDPPNKMVCCPRWRAFRSSMEAVHDQPQRSYRLRRRLSGFARRRIFASRR